MPEGKLVAKKEIRKLFTIQKVCAATGLSRTGVIKMEQKGLIHPAVWEGPGKNRYYSVEEVERIFRIRCVQHCGFTREEIKELMKDETDYDTVLSELEKRRLNLDRLIQCMKFLSGRELPREVTEQDVPETYCFAKHFHKDDPEPDVVHLMEETLEEAIQAGETVNHYLPWHYRVPTEKVFSWTVPETRDIVCSIPLIAPLGRKEEVRYAPYHAFEIRVQGNSDTMPQEVRSLKNMIMSRGYVPEKQSMIIPLVNMMNDTEMKNNSTMVIIAVPSHENTADRE